MAKLTEGLIGSIKSAVKGGISAAKVSASGDQVTPLIKIIGKNFMTLPGIARDMNVARQNVQKLVKLEGGEPSRGADAHWLKEGEREKALEVQMEEGKPSPVKAVAKKVLEKTGITKILEEFKETKFFKTFTKYFKLGAIIAIFAYQFKDVFMEWIGGVWDSIKEKFNEFVGYIKTWFKETIEPLIDKVKEFVNDWVIEPIKSFFGKVVDFFKGYFEFWYNLVTSPIETVKNLWEKFKGVIDNVIQKIADTYVNLSFPLKKAADFLLPKKVQDELSARGKKEGAKEETKEEKEKKAAEEKKRVTDTEKAAKAVSEFPQEEEETPPAPKPKAAPPSPPPAPTPTPTAVPAAAAEPPKVPPAAAPSAAPAAKAAKPSDAKPAKVGSESGKKAMISAMDDAKITDPTQRAAIMAQVGHESGGFTTLSENLNYRASTLTKLFPKKFSSPDDAQRVAAGGPQSVAERIYGGRMGNAPEGGGEGFLYRGRGFIQLTGKQNYTKFGYANNPEELTKPEGAAESAIKYMAGYKGDWGDVKKLTKFVNGGYIGLEDRAKHFQAYLNEPEITQIASSSTATSGSSVASASMDLASGQRQQAKPSSPIIINAPTTNTTVVTEKKTQIVAAKQDSAKLGASRVA